MEAQEVRPGMTIFSNGGPRLISSVKFVTGPRGRPIVEIGGASTLLRYQLTDQVQVIPTIPTCKVNWSETEQCWVVNVVITGPPIKIKVNDETVGEISVE